MSYSIIKARKKLSYRLLESSLFFGSFLFISITIALSIWQPVLTALLLISYSLLWVFKLTINLIYALYSFKEYQKWSKFDIASLASCFNKKEEFLKKITEFQNRFSNKISWNQKLQNDIANYILIENTKYQNIENIFQVVIFATYNENYEVLIRSLEYLYKSKWNLGKMLIVISQEDRMGKEHNDNVSNQINKLDWINSKTSLIPYKLNILITQHPDGIEGEIKGKASNEGWGTRQAHKYLISKQIDLDLVLVTSLDADSHIQPLFFQHLAIRFCLSPNRHQTGYQPVHIYSNNFFDIGFWPKIVSLQTTIYNLINLNLSGETHFFAIYSIPLKTLIEVDFWVRDVIAEDSLLFDKCLIHYDGDFKVVPHYGVFEGDGAESDDYLEEIIGQYKQLQRWAWGGVEGFPYLFDRFMKSDSKFELRKRLRWLYLRYTNHIFWATSPFIFGFGAFLPLFFYTGDVSNFNAGQNLIIFSQYFSYLSIIFSLVFVYFTFNLTITSYNKKKNQKINFKQVLEIIFQCLISPVIFLVMGLPALDAQLRGLTGNYLGYWVTPKK